MSKKVLFLVIAALVLAIAVGCAPSQPAQPTQPPAQPQQPAQPAATSAPKPVTVNNPPKSAEEVDAIDLMGKNVTVTYWHQRPQAQQDVLQAMLDDFNKNNPYGIKATAEIAGAAYPDVYNKVNAALQAGKPPEMSVAYQNQAAFYRGSNAVLDLTPFVGSKKYGLTADDLKDYFSSFLAADQNPQFKNERLGFPTQKSIEVMYYNADALKALGYSGPPKDWKTWEEAACKFSDASKNKYGWAFRHDASNFASQVFSRGGRVLSADGSQYVFNSQAGIDTIAMIQRMFKNKCAVEIPTSERNGEQNRFGNGDILFVFASNSGLTFYKQAVDKGAKFSWDTGLLPYADKPAVNLYGASVSVYKTTPEKELAAWLVIKFLGDKAQTTKWAVATGYFPVRQSVKDDVIAAYKKDPAWSGVTDSYAHMFDWLQYGMIESPVAGYDPVRDIIDKELMSRVLTDFTADPKKLLDDAAAKANAILKENTPK